jgi:hypothetical protein
MLTAHAGRRITTTMARLIRRFAGISILFVGVAIAQPDAKSLEFEVASIKLADPGARVSNVLFDAGEDLTITNVPLRKIVTSRMRTKSAISSSQEPHPGSARNVTISRRERLALTQPPRLPLRIVRPAVKAPPSLTAFARGFGRCWPPGSASWSIMKPKSRRY